MAGLIEIGISAWTEKTLVASGWYPKGTSSPEARLRYYATQFPIVENDSTYYALPAPEQAERWVLRTPDRFTMNVKAYAPLTEHYTDPKRLPSDLRGALPAELLAKRNVYPRDLGDEMMNEIAARFRAALEPLRASGKLGVVLFQYPVWFAASPENHEKLARVGELVPGCRVAVEMRNATWMSDKNRRRTLDLMRDAGLVYTCVDEPQGFVSSIPPVAAATSDDLALVRFHGRSESRWTKKTPTAADRFRYRYSVAELAEWVPKIRRLANEAKTVQVIMNNCYSDYAVRNAKELTELLERGARIARARARAPAAAAPPRA
jgi:uncharacterized protein YecE (DUF72 family)